VKANLKHFSKLGPNNSKVKFDCFEVKNYEYND